MESTPPTEEPRGCSWADIDDLSGDETWGKRAAEYLQSHPTTAAHASNSGSSSLNEKGAGTLSQAMDALWIGGLGHRHNEQWLRQQFAPHSLRRIFEMGPGFAICEFPQTAVQTVMEQYHNAKIDGKKFVIKKSTKYPLLSDSSNHNHDLNENNQVSSASASSTLALKPEVPCQNKEDMGVIETDTLWIGGLSHRHDEPWLFDRFKEYRIRRIVEKGPGFALVEFPKDVCQRVIDNFDNVKIDRKKLVVRKGKKTAQTDSKEN